jgi:hypothetical protein
MITILALRLGQVEEKTFPELLDQTIRRADKTVQWLHPNRPVFPAMAHSQSTGFDLDMPCTVAGHLARLKEMARSAGITQKMTGHALRRGAMRDLAHCPDKATSVDTEAARHLAGHSIGVRDKGTTADYIGDIEEDLYTRRTQNPFKSKRIIQVNELEDISFNTSLFRPGYGRVTCQFYTSDQDEATATISKDDVSEANTSDNEDNPYDAATSPVPSDSKDNFSFELDRILEGQIDNLIVTEDGRDETIDIDAVVNETGGLLEEAASQHDQETEMTTEQTHSQDRAITLLSILEGNADSFVDFFSSINSVKHSNGKKRPFDDYMIGNSRDNPTCFTYACATTGCTYASSIHGDFVRHLRKCTGLDQRPQEKFKCPKCPSSFDSERKLNGHDQRMHNWSPQPCNKCESDNKDVVYTTKEELRAHVKDAHEQKFMCPHPECRAQRCPPDDYTLRTVKVHLSAVHGLQKSEINELLNLSPEPKRRKTSQN